MYTMRSNFYFKVILALNLNILFDNDQYHNLYKYHTEIHIVREDNNVIFFIQDLHDRFSSTIISNIYKPFFLSLK